MIIVGSSYSFTLPSYTDAFGKHCSANLVLGGKAREFIEYDEATLTLKLLIDPLLLSDYIGGYCAILTLKDSREAIKKIIFNISVK